MNKENEKKNPADLYPGVDLNIADDDKVKEKLEKERIKTLDSNPRDGKP